MTDITIETLLARLGLAGDFAAKARAILEEDRITNSRKSHIAAAKSEVARAAIDKRFQRLCHVCATRVPLDGRLAVQVPPPACPGCNGSTSRRAVDAMAERCRRRGIRRVVLIGGSPNMRRELGELVSDRIELRLVDGTRTIDRSAARRDIKWADLIVVLGATQLAHKVSTLYTRDVEARRKLITTRRRGIEAIAEEITASDVVTGASSERLNP